MFCCTCSLMFQFFIELKMSSNFKYSLTKVYKNYTKYVPELKSTAVLQTIVQSKSSRYANICRVKFGVVYK